MGEELLGMGEGAAVGGVDAVERQAGGLQFDQRGLVQINVSLAGVSGADGGGGADARM